LASLTTLDMCRSKAPPVPLSELFLSAPKSDSCCWLRAESQALFLSDLKPQSCPASELFLFWHAGEASLGSITGRWKTAFVAPNDIERHLSPLSWPAHRNRLIRPPDRLHGVQSVGRAGDATLPMQLREEDLQAIKASRR
jgi:hypothetical protein